MSTATTPQPAGSTATVGSADTQAASLIVGFGLANEEYGVDILYTQEIIRIGHITELPGAPGFMRGLINLRGHVIPVIDLRARFGLPSAEPTDASRIIVLNVGQRTTGVIVDAVSHVLRVDQSQIRPAPRGVVGARDEFVSSIVRLEDRLLILLNIEGVVAFGPCLDS